MHLSIGPCVYSDPHIGGEETTWPTLGRRRLHLRGLATGGPTAMFEKSLTTLIKGLRSHRGRDEATYISNRIQEIRTEVRSADMEVKAEAVLKLAYLRMLGYEVQSASFPVLETMASSQYHIKHIGYLAAALCFSEDTEVLILATNLIKKDLHSAQPLDVQAALNGLSHVINQELAQHLAEDIAMMLTHSKPRVRKRAVLVLYSAIVRYPEVLDRTWERLRDLLCDSDQGVVTATVNVICELARRNPRPFVPLSPQLFEILTQTSNNWLLIKVVKLFGALARVEPRLVRKLQRPIAEIISTTPAMSVLYECIHTAIIGHMLEGADSEDFAMRCIDNLGQFLSDADQNLQYIALLALAKLAPTHPALVAQHEATILAAIRHPDRTIQVRALDLVCQLATNGSMRTILDTLLTYVEEPQGGAASGGASAGGASHALQSALDAHATVRTADAPPMPDADDQAGLRAQIAESILELGGADAYAHVPDRGWYFGILQRLMVCVRPDVAQQVADQMIDLVHRSAPLRPAACAALEQRWLHAADEHLGRDSAEGEWLRAGAWTCGEYPEYVTAPAQLARAVLQPHTAELRAPVLAVCIQSALKLCAHYAASLSPVWDAAQRSELEQLVEHLVAQLAPLVHHQDSDVHERAQESLQLLTILQQGLASELGAALPSDRLDAAESAEEHGWDDRASAESRTAPRALHLLEPLFFTRGDIQEDEQALPMLPPSFDLHAWIVPEKAWDAILAHVEPAAKPRTRPVESASRAPSKGTRPKDPSRPKKNKKSEQLPAAPHAAVEDGELNDIPIVQLSLSDLTPQTPAHGTPSASSDTPATVPTVQPKIVTRKKKARS